MPYDNPFDKFNTPSSKILFPVGERKVGWQQRDGGYHEVGDYKAIIRLNEKGDNAHLLNIVGANYKLIHNKELFTTIEDAMLSEMSSTDLHGVEVKDKVSGLGKTCYREYIFPSVRRRLANTVGDLGFRIIVQNGYGGSALRIHAGAIDFFCTNGMVRGEYVSTYKRHTKGVVIGNLNKTIHAAFAEFAETVKEAATWSQTPVTHDKAMNLFRELATSDKMYDGLADQYVRELDTRGRNLWAVYSALTYYASHPEGAFMMRRSVEEQDMTATVMLRHELDVAKWTKTDAWKALELT